MRAWSMKTIGGPLLGFLWFMPASPAFGQAAQQDSPTVAPLGTPSLAAMAGRLGLEPATASALQQALNARDSAGAERLLLAEIDKDPHSANSAKLLAFTGSVYFLTEDYLNAAIAWKKSDAITPLDPHLRFSLAMAYLRIAKPDWARTELKALAAGAPRDALYPYWLGRLDYDAEHFDEAIAHLQHAVALSPEMARAYDNLGLCYFRQNKNDLAVESFEKAIDLEKSSMKPSAWPYLNLAITQQSLDRLPDAEVNLRKALGIDPEFAQAHFQLGLVLESTAHLDDAVAEFQEAARINAKYAEPHMALARIFKKQGKQSAAQEQVAIYLRLHPRETP